MCLTSATFASGSRARMSADTTGDDGGVGAGVVVLFIVRPPGRPGPPGGRAGAACRETQHESYEDALHDARTLARGVVSGRTSSNFERSVTYDPSDRMLSVSAKRWSMRMSL